MYNKLFKDKNGKYPAWAWPGGYPIYYLSKGHDILCADCVNKNDEDILACDAHYEGPSLICIDCHAVIESSYGEVEDKIYE